MHWALIGVFVAAVAYGTATILQTIGARRTERTTNVDPRLLLRLLRSLPFIIGLTMDGAGFALSLAALRTLPLFVVQAAISSSLAVTAVLAAVFLHSRLRLHEWLAIGLVCLGLSLLGLAAGPEHPANVSLLGRFGLLAGVAAIAGVALLTNHVGDQSAWALGVLAGLAYGGSSIGARILHHPGSLAGLLTDPAAYGLAVSGLLGLLLYATAVQRSRVTIVTGAVVAAQSLVPAAIGVTLLGDHARRGFVGVGIAGFVLTILGALNLARYGEVDVPASVGRTEVAEQV